MAFSSNVQPPNQHKIVSCRSHTEDSVAYAPSIQLSMSCSSNILWPWTERRIRGYELANGQRAFAQWCHEALWPLTMTGTHLFNFIALRSH